MKKPSIIRDAIDESLSGVRFNAEDARSVLRAVRNRESAPERPARPRRRMRLDLAFACAMLLMLVAPVSFFALRVRNTPATNVAAGPGGASALPQITAAPQEDRIVTPDAHTDEERIAVRAARACFEAQCDTSIFTFEEYAVRVVPGGDGTRCTVEMTSIYGNGCRFAVEVALPEGEVISFSTPALATVPTYLDAGAPEIRAWYAKYGAFLFTWPAQEQAEFSRRYEGGALRMPRAGELGFEEAKTLALSSAAEMLGLDGELSYAYPSLYAGASDADAHYVVYCSQLPVTDTLPQEGLAVTVTFSATGENVSLTVENGTPLDSPPAP